VSQQETVHDNADSVACRIVDVAERLASQVNMTCEIPPNYDPSNLWYRQVIAEIRHEFTNYEQLLEELPLCVDHVAAGGECVWDTEAGLECSLAEEAHKIIKWAANRVAEAEYDKWQNTQQT
jgi:hypothetical protein